MTDQQKFDALKARAEAEMETEVLSTQKCKCDRKARRAGYSGFRHGFLVCQDCNGLVY